MAVNSQAHSVPFEIEGADVQDFQVPRHESILTEVNELVDTWQNITDLIDYVDYSVDQIRNAKALAQAAKDKAAFAERTARGYLANVEYRRALIEAALESVYSQGLIKEPKLKSESYSLGIQATAGRIEVHQDLDDWLLEAQPVFDFVNQLLLIQVMSGAPIELDATATEQLAKLSTTYLEKFGTAQDKDFKIFNIKISLSLDKKYLAQAIKNNWLTQKLEQFFATVKGKALVIRL